MLVFSACAHDFHEDPDPLRDRRSRGETPINRDEERGFWTLSRHADMLAALKNAHISSNSHGVSIDPSAEMHS